MKPEIEGTGGGFGKYQGKKLSEIEALFETCTQDVSMRSISAVLRITREQLDARGQLGVYPLFTWIAGIAFLCAGTSRAVVPGPGTVPDALRAGGLLRYLGQPGVVEFSTKAALGAGTVFLLLLATTLPSRHTRKVNVEQERIIRAMAVKALLKILEGEPPLKPLTVEQNMTVKILLKKAEGSEGLRVLL